MADGIVTSGEMGYLAEALTKKLGRRVVVHRVESKIKLPGKGLKLRTEIRYSLGISGSNPPVFFGMTTGEVKARMAMLLDLIISGVVHVEPRPQSTQDVRPGQGPDHQSAHSEAPQGGFSGGIPRGQVDDVQGGDEGGHQPPSPDDRY